MNFKNLPTYAGIVSRFCDHCRSHQIYRDQILYSRGVTIVYESYFLLQYLDWCCRAIPMGRIGEVEEVARLVAFLNGANFPIDGSYSNTSYIPKLG